MTELNAITVPPAAEPMASRFVRSDLLPAFAQDGGSDDDGTSDQGALLRWLAFTSLRNSNTARSYRTEVLRFRIFLECIHAGSPDRSPSHLLRDATEVDVALYESHLVGELRTGKPVEPLVVPAGILSKYQRDDQPFVEMHADTGSPAVVVAKRLKSSSVNLALSVLHALYQFWMKPEPGTKTAYVGANPVGRVKAASNRAPLQVSRNFPMEAILAMIASLDLQMAREPEGSVKVAAIERRRWILALLFGLWGRRSEIARLKMSDFVMDSASRWSVTLKRKGGRLDTIPLADWVVHALMRYRQSLGVSALPHATDDSGAIGLLRKRQSPGRADMPPGNQLIYREVLQAAREAACALRAGEVLPEMDAIQREAVASRLDELSPHWFRHSGASLAINTGALSLMNASKLLGHSSADITFRMYHHSNDSQITDGVQQLGGGAFV